MSTVGLAPISMDSAVLTIAADDFTAAVTGVTFYPQVSYEWVEHWDGTATPIYTGVRWGVRIDYLQDLTTPGSLTRYLFEQATTRRTAVFTPTTGGPAVVADVMIMPGPFGGVSTDGPVTGAVDLPLAGGPEVI